MSVGWIGMWTQLPFECFDSWYLTDLAYKETVFFFKRIVNPINDLIFMSFQTFMTKH